MLKNLFLNLENRNQSNFLFCFPRFSNFDPKPIPKLMWVLLLGFSTQAQNDYNYLGNLGCFSIAHKVTGPTNLLGFRSCPPPLLPFQLSEQRWDHYSHKSQYNILFFFKNVHMHLILCDVTENLTYHLILLNNIFEPHQLPHTVECGWLS